MDEIEKAINDEKDNSSSDATKQTENQPTEEEARKLQAQKELAEIEAAKAAALAELQKVRSDKRKAKKAPNADEIEEEEIPQIDMNDPSAKAWNKHIEEKVNPAIEEAEKGKAEIRQYALDQFLAARPAIARNPEKLKELMAMYERLHTASERTVEGVIMDLDRAYAAVYHQELLQAAQEQKIDTARRDAIFSDPAVSRGSTSYSSPKEQPVKLSAEEQAILAKWGMTPQEWQTMRNEQDKKQAESV